jgi:predicted DNA-binding transcriptional regulator AlpA
MEQQMNALNTAQAARFLGISPHTVRKYTFLKLLPHMKIGQRVVFLNSELAEWRARRRVAALDEKKVGRG